MPNIVIGAEPKPAPNGGSGAAAQRNPWRAVIAAGLRYASASARQAGKIFAPCTETGTLATGELADHQPHVDDYIARAQLITRGLKRDPPTRNPSSKL